MPISLAGPCALATEAQVVELSGVRKCFFIDWRPTTSFTCKTTW